MKRYFATAAVATIASLQFCHATIFLSDNYGTYSNGNLVGQDGYVQTGTQATNPIQVNNGAVVLAPVVANDQDAYKTFTPVAAPTQTGETVSLFYSLKMAVNVASTVASYFFATDDGLNTANSFDNGRLAAVSSGSNTFQLGVRVTGQGGYPYAFGSDLVLGSTLNVVIKLNLNAGAQNDTIDLFVNPTSGDLSQQTPYATGFYNTGAGTDPLSLGAIVLSQFGNATSAGNAVSIYQVAVGDNFSEIYALTAVPEPSSVLLLTVGAGLFLGRARRRGVVNS